MLLIFGVNVPVQPPKNNQHRQELPNHPCDKNFLFGDAKLRKKGPHHLVFEHFFNGHRLRHHPRRLRRHTQTHLHPQLSTPLTHLCPRLAIIIVPAPNALRRSNTHPHPHSKPTLCEEIFRSFFYIWIFLTNFSVNNPSNSY